MSGQTFYVTFGMQYGAEAYGAEPHPILGYTYAHHDGYLTVHAKDEFEARSFLFAMLEARWSMIYTVEEWERDPERQREVWYPRGSLLTLDVQHEQPTLVPAVVLKALWDSERSRGFVHNNLEQQRMVVMDSGHQFVCSLDDLANLREVRDDADRT